MTQASSQYFKEVAGSWDAIRAGYFGEAVRNSAVAKAYLRPEMAVADIGSGTGFIAAGLAPLVKRVYVVDGSVEMLDVARKNLAEFSNVEYHHADGLTLPFLEESLDAVFANMYLHHCADPVAALQEMIRVLRPGGRLVITDMDEHPYAWLKDEMADVWQGFPRAQMRGWLREAGLVNVIVDCTGESCCATSGQCDASKNTEASCSCASDNAEQKTEAGNEAHISIFVATGTRRMHMRDSVQDAYASHAQNNSGCGCSEDSCCGGEAAVATTSCCCSSEAEVSFSILPEYSGENLDEVPAEAAEFSLGCGNPLAMARLKPGEVVVDIGSGGGLDSFLAAARVGENGHVIGVDMTPAMLERARASAAKAGVENVVFRQGYAENLPVDDNSVDVIISNCVINLTEDKGLVFQEAFRVLRSGGRLEVSDVVTGGAMPFDAIGDAYTWSECVSGALPEQEYLDLILQAGFSQVSVRHKSGSGSLAGVPIYSAIVSAVKP